MDEQRSPWAQPGVIAVLGVIVGINLAADWFLFRPKNWLFFVAVEAVVLGGIIAVTRWVVLRRRPRA